MRPLRCPALLALLLTGCPYISADDLDARMDLDGDGVPRPEDCDDDDPGVTIPVWYLDLDGDGYGGGTSEESCVAPQSYVTETGDCDDDDAAVFPGAEELCNGIDDDCDQDVDEELPEQTWYLDYDGDGYGGSEITEQACGPSSNHVGNADDCDDADPAVSPAAQEVCDADDVDEDCDGLADDTDSSVDTSTQVTVYQDLDGDGYGVEGKTSSACDPGDGWALVAEDCDDSDPALHPDTLWYRDADEDGYGDAAYSVRSCHEVEAYVPNALDCDDGEAAYNPDAQEVCDAADIDEDCDGLVDDADDTVAEQFTIYEDVDGDGYGDDSTETLACDQWSGWVLVGGDCDTADASTNPGAEEIWYDGHDRDCDGWDDYDADYDGYVSDAHSGTDCDDTLPLVNPGMDEACGDELDNDCDGVVAGNCLLEGEISLEEAHAAIYGSNSSDYFGCGFESAGDHDGDGYEDLIVAGKCGFASGAQVSVFEGPFSGASTLSDALCTYVAEPGGESTSVEVSSGDLNNDGLSDLVVGYPSYAAISLSQGRSYVLFGPHSGGEWSLGGADLVFDGAMGSAVFGGSVGAGGDVDGDGVDDLLVSANYEDALGAAYLWFGPVTSGGDSSSADLRIGAQAGDVRLGLNLSMGGDCSGDGLGDIAVMAYEGPDAGDMAGVVYFFDTAPTGSVDTSAASAVMWGEDDSSYAGMDMAMGGDVNGDGYGDLAIGAYGLRPPGQYTSDGAAYVVFGPLTASGSLGTADFRVLGEWTDGHTGISVSIDGDVNGDGRDDLLVGSDESVHYTTGGGASLFYGPVTGSMWTSDSDAHFPAQYEDDYAGQSVAIIPSLDSDVYADLAIGVQRDNTASTHAGAVYLFYGGEY